MILSKFKKLTDLPMDGRNDKNWCLERLNTPGANAQGSPLKMRPCDNLRIKQMWLYDRSEKVIISADNNKEFCIARDGRQLVSRACTAGTSNVSTTISPGALNLMQDETQTGPISMETSKNEFYFAIDSLRIFSRVKLLKKGTENSSYDKWQFRYHGPSEFPSSVS